MSTREVATRLYELCQKGEFQKVQDELFADNATSTESNLNGQREKNSSINITS